MTGGRLFYATVGWIVIALCVANIFFASVGFLAVLTLLALNEPMGIFMNAVGEVTEHAQDQ